MAKFWLSLFNTHRRLALIVSAIVLSIIIAWLPIDFLVDKSASWTVRLILASLAVSMTSAAIFVSDQFTKRDANLGWRQWFNLRMGAVLLLGFQGVFGFLSDAAGLIEPRNSVESEPLAIERAVNRVSAMLSGIATDVRVVRSDTAVIKGALGVGQALMILERIEGQWGERGCEVVRRIAVNERSFTISTMRVPAGMTGREWRFTIESDNAAMNEVQRAGMRTSSIAATEREGLNIGQSVLFRYKWDGASDYLEWDGQSDAQPMIELHRCM